MTTVELKAALQAACAAAQAAGEVITHYWQHGVEVELKDDATPVTVADWEAELAIRRVLQTVLPQAAVYGEEFGGAEQAHSEWLWLVDPLDGTKSFVRRTPFFSTQIALMHQGELVLGVSHAPIYGETMWALAGEGAWFEGPRSERERVRISETATLVEAAISTGNIKSLSADPACWQVLAELIQGCNRIRGYGDFCHYHLLARGSLDLVLESDVSILDVAALAVIVGEAGGLFTDLDGQPLTLSSRSVLAGTPSLHALALQQLHAARAS